MSADDERDVRQRLDRAFGTLTAQPAPVEQAIRQGRQIRARRRRTALAGLAAMAAVAVAVPVALGRVPDRPNGLARPGHHVVTVYPPTARQARNLVIAWGSVDGERWQLRADHTIDGVQCVAMLINAKCGSALKLSGHEPANLGEFSRPAEKHTRQITYVYGPVAADVTYVKVSLTTGTVLTLHPVRVVGERFVGFAVPPGTIDQVTAYSRRGVLATLKIVAWPP